MSLSSRAGTNHPLPSQPVSCLLWKSSYWDLAALHCLKSHLWLPQNFWV